MNRTCAKCRWWREVVGFHRNDGVPSGECRWSSPRIFQAGAEGKLMTRWPLVAAADFCGDHEPRDEGGAR